MKNIFDWGLIIALMIFGFCILLLELMDYKSGFVIFLIFALTIGNEIRTKVKK